MRLTAAAAALAGRVAPESAHVLRVHMAVINAYYSNLIEGHRTLPHDIRQAQRGQYNEDPAKRNLQLESVAHIVVQKWLDDTQPDLN